MRPPFLRRPFTSKSPSKFSAELQSAIRLGWPVTAAPRGADCRQSHPPGASGVSCCRLSSRTCNAPRTRHEQARQVTLRRSRQVLYGDSGQRGASARTGSRPDLGEVCELVWSVLVSSGGLGPWGVHDFLENFYSDT